MFEIGETAHFWRGAGGRIVVPEEVTIVAITPRQITARDGAGQLLRFRARDCRLFGSGGAGPHLRKLDHALADQQTRARALEDMRRAIFSGTDFGLQAMRMWSEDKQVLRHLAAAYRAFLHRALDLGADVPRYLREWLEQEEDDLVAGLDGGRADWRNGEE